MLATFAALEMQGRHHNDQSFACVADVSRVGIAVRTGQPPLPGQQVAVRIALGEEIHEVITAVTRIAQRGTDLFEVGLDWSRCPPETLAFSMFFQRFDWKALSISASVMSLLRSPRFQFQHISQRASQTNVQWKISTVG